MQKLTENKFGESVPKCVICLVFVEKIEIPKNGKLMKDCNKLYDLQEKRTKSLYMDFAQYGLGHENSFWIYEFDKQRIVFLNQK